MLELREIEIFLTLAEELHFGRASERLRITTSHLSQLVKRIERRIGAQLFERTSRQVVLNSLGKRLLADIVPSYEQLCAALDRARASAHGAGGDHVVVAFPIAVVDYSSALAGVFERRHAAVDIAQMQLTIQQLSNTLRTDAGLPAGVDVLVTWAPATDSSVLPPGLAVGAVIQRARRAIAVHRGHPLAGRAMVDIEEIADHPVLFGSSAPWACSYADRWIPPQTPGGRSIRRVVRDIVYSEQIHDALCDGLVRFTVDDPSEVPFSDTVVIPVRGLPRAALVCVVADRQRTDVVDEFLGVAADYFATAPSKSTTARPRVARGN